MSPARPQNAVFAQAIAWSVVVHLSLVAGVAVPIAGKSLLGFITGGFVPPESPGLPTPAPTELREIEVEVPMIEVVKPPPQKDEAFIDTEGLPTTDEVPKNSAFISDRNTRAASDGAIDPNGPPVPSQDGLDVPVVEVIRRQLSEGETTSPPGPPSTPATAETSIAPAPEPTPPAPPPTPEPALPPAAEALATAPEAETQVRVEKTPPTPKKAPTEPKLREPRLEPLPAEPVAETKPPKPESKTAQNSPPAPKAGFQGQREKTKLSGSISNRGPASVDAADTPAGRYMKQVTSAVEKEWHHKRREFADFVTYGTIKLEFWVDAKGRVTKIDIKNRNGANAVMQDFTLNAVLDAKIPPMPAGLTDILDNDRLQITYDIIVY